MADSQIIEFYLSAKDYRLLSANAEGWMLVKENVFSSLDQFLTGESRGAFLSHVTAQDAGWFPLRFLHMPRVLFLASAQREQDGGEDRLRLTLLDPQEIMPGYMRLQKQTGVMEAMLSLTEDVYFVFWPKEESIALYNTAQSRWEEGERPLSAFASDLLKVCGEKNRAELDGLFAHLRNLPPRFRVHIGCNLLNGDQAVTATLAKGALCVQAGEKCVVGVLHPERMRGSREKDTAADPLTGLHNKEAITRLAQERVNVLKAQGTTLAIVDIDYFKHVNDHYGHQFGDEVLRRVAAILETEIGSRGAVGRIGGDEFMIVFYKVDEEELRACLRTIKTVVGSAFPGKGPRPDSGITVSIGAAAYPRNAGNYDDLFTLADYCLYLAKEKGRNRYIHYTPEKHPSLADIQKSQTEGEGALVNGRYDLAPGDVLAQMQYMIRYGQRPGPEEVLSEFADRFRIPLAMLYLRSEDRLIAAAGPQKNDGEAAALGRALPFVAGLRLKQFQTEGMTVLNNVDKMVGAEESVRDELLIMDVRSIVILPFSDAGGSRAALIFASLHRNLFFNEEHYLYYRLFADELARYDLKKEGNPS